MKKLIVLSFLMSSLTVMAQNVLFSNYREIPDDEVFEKLIVNFNTSDVDSLSMLAVDSVKEVSLNDGNFYKYLFINNENAIYHYRKGDFNSFIKILSESAKNVPMQNRNNFEFAINLYLQSYYLARNNELNKRKTVLDSCYFLAKKLGYHEFAMKNVGKNLIDYYLNIKDFNHAFSLVDTIIKENSPIVSDTNRINVAYIYNTIGNNLVRIDPAIAASYMERADKLYEQTTIYKGNPAQRMYSLGSLTKAYMQLEDFEKAIATNNRRYEMIDSTTQFIRITNVYNLFYQIYLRKNNYRKSKDYALKEVKLHEASGKIKSVFAYSDALCCLGNAYKFLHDYDSAFYYLDKAYNLSVNYYNNEMHPALHRIYFYYGNLNYVKGNYLESVQAFDKSLRCKMGIDDTTKIDFSSIPLSATRDIVTLLSMYNRTLLALADKAKDEKLLLDIVRNSHVIYQLTANSYSLSQDEEFALDYSSRIKEALMFSVYACEKLHSKYEQHSYADTGLFFMEQSKLFHFKNRKLMAKSIKGLPDSLKNKYMGLQQDMLVAKAKYVGNSQQKFDQNNNMLKLKSKIRTYSDTVFYKPDLSIVSKSNCPKNTSYITYLTYGDSVIIFGLNNSKSYITSLVLPDLKNKIKTFKRSIKTGGDYKQYGTKIYNDLVEPMAEIISTSENLIISTDSYLNNIPFELLIDKSGQRLIDKHTVKYSYTLYNHKDTTKPKDLSLMAIAPFASGDYDLNSTLATIVESRGSDPYFKGAKLPNLPFTKEEIVSVKKLFVKNKFNVDVYLNKKATKNNLIKELPNYSILHFATHGISSDNNFTSGIFLGSKSEVTTEKDILLLYELYSQNLNADLVVLSACKTGVGKIEEGEGVMALPRGFIYAGVPNVIASLWKVHDKKTKDLMVAFYKHLLEDKVSYAEALRLAKLDCIQKGFLPLDWAGFILIGE